MGAVRRPTGPTGSWTAPPSSRSVPSSISWWQTCRSPSLRDLPAAGGGVCHLGGVGVGVVPGAVPVPVVVRLVADLAGRVGDPRTGVDRRPALRARPLVPADEHDLRVAVAADPRHCLLR